MIIWRGWGIIVPIIVTIVAFCGTMIVKYFFGAGYWKATDWPLGTAFIVAGAIIWAVDETLNKNSEKTLLDEQTGERITLIQKNDLFFLPMKLWALASVGLGLWISIMGKF